VLLSTHILPEVEAVCDRVLIIDRGRIVAEGTPSELRGKLAGTPVVRAVFKGGVPAREALGALPGVSTVDLEDAPGETRARLTCLPGSDPREDVFRLAVEGWVLRELAREAMSLEDVFVRLTRRAAAPSSRRDGGAARLRGDPVVKKLFAIVGREWRAYFLSPLAYVILAAFLLMNGFIFAFIMNFLNSPTAPKGQALVLLFTNTYFWIFNLFVVPIIAMRLFAEERKSGTLEMLLTSPVSEGTVVLGKFLGALGFFLTLGAHAPTWRSCAGRRRSTSAVASATSPSP
jgi:hypothetical protein